MTPVEALKKAREFLSDESRWCQHRFYMGTKGEPDYKCCATRALWDATGAGRRIEYQRAAYLLADACGGYVPEFNDASITTHADVLAAFDRAIALAEAEA